MAQFKEYWKLIPKYENSKLREWTYILVNMYKGKF